MTTPLPQQPAGDGITAVLVALARVEGKLDAVTAQHGAKLEEHTRRLDEQARRADETEDRVRALEIRPSVTPGKMFAAAVGMAGLVAAASPFLDKLYS